MGFRWLSVLAALVLPVASCLAADGTAGAAQAGAKFSVHHVFGDHMVLQRERPVKISGVAEAGQKVTVTIGANSATATADQDGEWEAVLPAMKAGGPYEVKVQGPEGSKVVFQDVLVGEVWMCSGQSNMEMPLLGGRPFWNVKNAEEEVKNANYPEIRLFNTVLKRSTAPEGPVKEIAGPGWAVCSPETAAKFSAAGYFFGRQLNQDLKIPVGLVNSSWGGTPIQSWISESGYRSAGRNGEVSRIENARKNPEDAKTQQEKDTKAFAAWEEKFNACGAATAAQDEMWRKPDFDDSGWKPARLGDSFPDGVDGVAWYRTSVELPEAWAGKDLALSLGVIDDCDVTYFNGEKVGATGGDVPQYWQKQREYKVPGKLVKAGKNVLAVRVSDFASGGGLFGPENKMNLVLQGGKDSPVSIASGWKMQLEFAADYAKIGKRPEPMLATRNNPHFPATLYNAMIAPWTVYPMRGAIWYQGESNAGAWEDYMALHPLLISNWRTLWKDPDFAFVFVQLSAFQKHTPKDRLADDFWVKEQPADNSWSKLREVQTATLNVPRTGMAVTIDIGDHSDIHPTNKQDVGYRLAREAERVCYGRKEVSAGPLYEKMAVEGDKIRLTFKNVGSGLMGKDGELKAFAIAGEDGKFVWAKAVVDGSTVVVSSDTVPAPKAVRYAWSMFPGNANFCNKDGFPASPFRTDAPAYLLKAPEAK